MASTDTKTPMFACGFLILLGIIIASLGDWLRGSIAGGLVAMFGAGPAAWSAWLAMRAEEQGAMARALVMVFLSLGVGAFFIMLWVIEWIRH
jgi:hypothetical protein